SSNKSAQEAHEAIRPTDVDLTPELAAGKLGADEYKLYQLIWRRFVACQMPPAEFDQTSVTITAPVPPVSSPAEAKRATGPKTAGEDTGGTIGGTATFRASGRKLVFDGYMKVAGVSSD